MKMGTERALWINGAGGELIDNSLEYYVCQKRNALRRDISVLRQKASRYHTKKIKNNVYWYFVENGKWKFVGKEDPRPDIMRQVAEIETRIKPLEERMRSCIIKKIGRHLVVDLSIVKKEIPAARAEIIPVSEVES